MLAERVKGGNNAFTLWLNKNGNYAAGAKWKAVSPKAKAALRDEAKEIKAKVGIKRNWRTRLVDIFPCGILAFCCVSRFSWTASTL